MSYQYKRSDTKVIVCDLCQDFSWVSDHRWRPTLQSTAERPMHLCPACRHVAQWCSTHQQYHMPDAFHRHACADCGGLFTSVVRDAITRCPSCRRVAGEVFARPAPAPVKQPRSWMQILFTARGSERH